MRKCLIMFGLLLVLLLVTAFTEKAVNVDSVQENIVVNNSLDDLKIKEYK